MRHYSKQAITDHDQPTKNKMNDDDSHHIPHYLHGASPQEQAGAGINAHDHPFGAAAKLEMDRRARGVDIYTGLPLQDNSSKTPTFVQDSVAGASKRSAWGTLYKVILVIFLCMVGYMCIEFLIVYADIIINKRPIRSS